MFPPLEIMRTHISQSVKNGCSPYSKQRVRLPNKRKKLWWPRFLPVGRLEVQKTHR